MTFSLHVDLHKALLACVAWCVGACVMPILLYGCENWLMTHALMEKVESFLAELAKRVLKWPKHHSNTAAVVASGWNADSEKHNSGKEVGVPAEGTECRFKVCEWQAGGSDV